MESSKGDWHLTDSITLIWQYKSWIIENANSLDLFVDPSSAGRWLPITVPKIMQFALQGERDQRELRGAAAAHFDYKKLCEVAVQSECFADALNTFTFHSSTAMIVGMSDKIAEVRVEIGTGLLSIFSSTKDAQLRPYINRKPEDAYFPEWMAEFERTDFFKFVRSSSMNTVSVEDLDAVCKKAEAELRACYIQGQSIPSKPKKGKRGAPKARDDDADKKLVRDWESAKSQNSDRDTFCKEHGIKLKHLESAQRSVNRSKS